MAAVEMGGEPERAAGPDPNEAMFIDKMVKRSRPTSPIPGPPHKSPRTQSPPPPTQPPPPPAQSPPPAPPTAAPPADAPGGAPTSEAVVPAEEDTLEGSVCPGEAPPALSPPARRKSWKRSTVGRRSLSAPANRSQTLCRSISPSLPPQERLEKLMEASMKLALERTQRLLESTPNASLESFKKRAEDMQPEWRSMAAQLRDRRSPPQPPASKDNDPPTPRALAETQSAIHRQVLQAEVDAWDALLTKHRHKAEALASQVERGQQGGVTLDAASLSHSSQWPLIQQKPDYGAALSRQQPALRTIQLMRQMVRELLSIQEVARLQVKETSGRLAADAGIPEPSPDLVRNLISCLKT
ncbi:hypothetical protein CRUP_036751 [Coryphaenoides rupestris]|nr:hypothetical protein CRUP_036751 [Coryphaenoides rupestris]